MQVGSVIINLPAPECEVVTPGPQGGGENVRGEVGVMLPIYCELPLRLLPGDPDRNADVAPAECFPIATWSIPRHYSLQIFFFYDNRIILSLTFGGHLIGASTNLLGLHVECQELVPDTASLPRHHRGQDQHVPNAALGELSGVKPSKKALVLIKIGIDFPDLMHIDNSVGFVSPGCLVILT